MNAPQNAPNAFHATKAVCPVCKVEFEAKRRWQRFCSAACRRKHHATPDDAAKLRKELEELRERVARIEGFLVL